MLIHEVFILAVVFFGLLLGSFLNVVIYRLPKTRAAGVRDGDRHSLLYLAWPMSFCPHCKAQIPPWRNVPLLSYFLLRGSAKCCDGRIHWRYPAVEALGVVIVFAAVWGYRHPVDIAMVVVFLSLLLAMSVIDLRTFYLLDILTLPLLWLGLLANIDSRFALLQDAVLGAAAGYLSLFFVAGAFSAIVRKQAMGMGDFKLFAALGAWLGWQPLPMLLFIAALLGVILAAGQRLTRGRGRGRRVPFGPCLAGAGALMLFWGDDIMLGYWNFISP